jgi:hypothetical protein
VGVWGAAHTPAPPPRAAAPLLSLVRRGCAERMDAVESGGATRAARRSWPAVLLSAPSPLNSSSNPLIRPNSARGRRQGVGGDLGAPRGCSLKRSTRGPQGSIRGQPKGVSDPRSRAGRRRRVTRVTMHGHRPPARARDLICVESTTTTRAALRCALKQPGRERRTTRRRPSTAGRHAHERPTECKQPPPPRHACSSAETRRSAPALALNQRQGTQS